MQTREDPAIADGIDPQPDGETLLLRAERAEIVRRSVVSGLVDISLQTVERTETISADLATDQLDVQRVTIGRLIDTMPQTREEGDTTIIPVVEEVLVTEKRLMLKEEIHVRRVRITRTETRHVVLREQHAEITRSVPGNMTLPDPDPSTHKDA